VQGENCRMGLEVWNLRMGIWRHFILQKGEKKGRDKRVWGGEKAGGSDAADSSHRVTDSEEISTLRNKRVPEQRKELECQVAGRERGE